MTYICDFGYIYERGTIPTCEDAGILPALRIDLDRAQIEPAGTVSSGDILKGASRSEAEDDPQKKERIVNPLVRPDPEAPDGKGVTYALVRFGSYPQSEITPASDGKLYENLENAEWDRDECDLNRVSASGDTARYFACDPLLWRVLEVRDGTAFLLLHAAVECEPFQSDLRDVSWENCSLRSWLNGYGANANASATDFSGNGKTS